MTSQVQRRDHGVLDSTGHRYHSLHTWKTQGTPRKRTQKKMLEPEVWSEKHSSPLSGTGHSHYTRPSAVVPCTRPAYSWTWQPFVVKQGKVHKTPSVPEGLRRDLFNLASVWWLLLSRCVMIYWQIITTEWFDFLLKFWPFPAVPSPASWWGCDPEFTVSTGDASMSRPTFLEIRHPEEPRGSPLTVPRRNPRLQNKIRSIY